MDVVKRQIQKLRGSVEIESVPGVGTTFSLRLPLTLAIIEGLVVGVGPERYILPLSSVREIFRPTAGAVTSVEHRAEVVSVRDHLLPVLRLHERFRVEPRSAVAEESVCVVAEFDNTSFCLLVDDLIGKQEVVIKSLGPVFQHVSGIAGGAILGDGQIGLILDVKSLFEGSNHV
jgi:two-component system chemotaxis sensor kinase CheA